VFTAETEQNNLFAPSRREWYPFTRERGTVMAKILVVDDEASVVIVLREMLTRLGYSVVCASEATQALGLVSLSNIDMVITDLVMPHMNGVDLIIELKKRVPTLKIIAISAGSLEEGPEKYLELAKTAGVDRCLQKPFMLNTLSTMVKELLPE
jgi:CheY-like chemotaxis protein